MTRARLLQIEKRVREFAGWHGIDDIGPKFLEACGRGMILCKDGKERTVDEWLKTVAPDLAEKLSKLSDPSKAPGESWLNGTGESARKP
jgi:hypothetical protein